jgi:hypothetical protein
MLTSNTVSQNRVGTPRHNRRLSVQSRIRRESKALPAVLRCLSSKAQIVLHGLGTNPTHKRNSPT